MGNVFFCCKGKHNRDESEPSTATSHAQSCPSNQKLWSEAGQEDQDNEAWSQPCTCGADRRNMDNSYDINVANHSYHASDSSFAKSTSRMDTSRETNDFTRADGG